MNANEPFVPKWADEELADRSAKPVLTISDVLKRNKDAEELAMLRAFFDAWEGLHAIPNLPKNRHKSEQAAQMLVDAAHAIRALRNG